VELYLHFPYAFTPWGLVKAQRQLYLFTFTDMRIFDKRVLRRIFEPKREEVAEDWRRLHNEKLHNLHSSINIIRVSKSMRMKWDCHVERVGR
jgi:hypothetical protein